MAETLSPQELHIMQHATGWKAKERLYRNRYVIAPDADTWKQIQGLCSRGLMAVGRDPERESGMTTFCVTEAGIATLKAYDGGGV